MTSPTVNLIKMAEGVLRQVNLASREIVLGQGSETRMFCIAPTCEVLLNGERVKLRLLQPSDRVQVTYRVDGRGRWALRIESRVRSESPGGPR